MPNPHARIDEENRERDRRTAAMLRANPETVHLARGNLCRWLQAEDDKPHSPLLEWEAVLDFLTPSEIAIFLESRSPMAERLRQSSPFVALSAGEPAVALTT